MPNYSPNIWTDSVLVRASPAQTKSPTSFIASNKTPVMSHRVQKEFCAGLFITAEEEQGISTPVFASITSSPALEVHQQSDEIYQQTSDELDQQNDHQKHEIHQLNNEYTNKAMKYMNKNMKYNNSKMKYTIKIKYVNKGVKYINHMIKYIIKMMIPFH